MRSFLTSKDFREGFDHPSEHLEIVPAFGLVCGVALYFAAHVAFRLRIGGGLGRGRPIAAVVLLLLLPVAMVVPAAAAIAMVAGVCVALIAYEVLWHYDERREIRVGREAVHLEDFAGRRSNPRWLQPLRRQP